MQRGRGRAGPAAAAVPQPPEKQPPRSAWPWFHLWGCWGGGSGGTGDSWSSSQHPGCEAARSRRLVAELSGMFFTQVGVTGRWVLQSSAKTFLVRVFRPGSVYLNVS